LSPLARDGRVSRDGALLPEPQRARHFNRLLPFRPRLTLSPAARRALALASLAVASLFWTSAASAQFTPYQADGFTGPHPTVSAGIDEHVDPLSGNLLISATDLVLPGNAGFDLVVQRFYSSQIFPDYESGQSMALEDDQWAGLGWRFHFGRILHTELTGAGQTIVELPGAGGGPLYHTSFYPEGWMTKGFARYNRSTNTLLLPNGMVYTFGQAVSMPRGGTVRYVTQIQDPYGNKIVFTYFTSPGPTDGLQSIRQYLSATEYRDVTFTYNSATNSLASMTYNGRTWTYTQSAFSTGGRSILTNVTQPSGWGTSYGYDGTTAELNNITAPAGGQVMIWYGATTRTASTTTHPARVVTRHKTLGYQIPLLDESFAYDQNTNKDTTITTEIVSGKQNGYRYVGVGVNGSFAAWSQGTLAEHWISDGMHIKQDDTFTWVASEALSNDAVPGQGGLWTDPAVYAPLLSSHAVTWGSYSVGTTNFAYHTGLNNFNDFGQAYQISETGRPRTTTLTFTTGFTPHILGRVATKQVTVGTDSVTSSALALKPPGLPAHQPQPHRPRRQPPRRQPPRRQPRTR
jgi:hypothetical protein